MHTPHVQGCLQDRGLLVPQAAQEHTNYVLQERKPLLALYLASKALTLS